MTSPQPTFDRALVGDVIRAEIERKHAKLTHFLPVVKLSRSLIERARDGDDTVTFAALRRIEGALVLPRDTLNYVGMHDVPALTAIGEALQGPARAEYADLIRTVRERITPNQPTDARNVK